MGVTAAEHRKKSSSSRENAGMGGCRIFPIRRASRAVVVLDAALFLFLLPLPGRCQADPSKPEAATSKVNPKDSQTYVWIRPGRFTMGCSPGDSQCNRDELRREVEIVRGFWLGRTEVPQAAYQKVMGENPSQFKGDKRPVDSVPWNKAIDYCQKVGGRLPSEEEWEYAARGGTTGARYGALDEVAWYEGNSGHQTHEVMTKEPNAFGIYDMLGGVEEWTSTWYDYDQRRIVMRGGDWDNSARSVRASFRMGASTTGLFTMYGGSQEGFRCALDSL